MHSESLSVPAADVVERNFSTYTLIQKLSHFSHTYLISADSVEYIVKTIKYKNFGSVVRHDAVHVEQLVEAASAINQTNNIATISIIDSSINTESSVFLFKKNDISTIELQTDAEFQNIGTAIKSFHNACSSIHFQTLPWNNFPEVYITELIGNNRWIEIEQFLSKYQEYVSLHQRVSCHNDIHAGNIFYSGDKIIFLDIDDICSDSYYNDLGMVMANFTDSSYTQLQLQVKMKSLMTGYSGTYSEADSINIAIYALRKLYFTEGYYWYFRKMTGETTSFIEELQKRQKLFQGMLDAHRIDLSFKTV
jgi:hypothetical protein